MAAKLSAATETNAMRGGERFIPGDDQQPSALSGRSER
jgi:hypothetical protein